MSGIQSVSTPRQSLFAQRYDPLPTKVNVPCTRPSVWSKRQATYRKNETLPPRPRSKNKASHDTDGLNDCCESKKEAGQHVFIQEGQIGFDWQPTGDDQLVFDSGQQKSESTDMRLSTAGGLTRSAEYDFTSHEIVVQQLGDLTRALMRS